MVKSPQAWVFNCDYNGLSVIQSLGRRGVQVRALDVRRGIGTRSRYANYFKVPDPKDDEAGFISALWHYRESVDANPVLFPTNDHWAESLSCHHDELSSAFHCCVADNRSVSLLLDKERFGRWCEFFDLPVPRVWSVEEALSDSDLPFPIAVKANARRRPGQGASWFRAADRLRFCPCADRAQMLAVLRQAQSSRVPVFIQQIVKGRSDSMRTIGLYARDGQILGMVFGRKYRGFPPEFGDCVIGIAEFVPQWARVIAKKVCAELNYTGLAEFELMVDSESKALFLIEINPRSWSWIGVSEPAGVPLAWLAYRNLVFKEVPDVTLMGCSDGEPVYYAKTLSDLQNVLFWYRFSDARDWVLSPWQWWQSFKGKRGVYAEFSRDDLMIGLFSALQAAKTFLGRLRRVLCGERF